MNIIGGVPQTPRTTHYHTEQHHFASQQNRPANVRFGSKADSCSAATHVRFTLNSDRESGHPQEFMSALPPKADMHRTSAFLLRARSGLLALFRQSGFP